MCVKIGVLFYVNEQKNVDVFGRSLEGLEVAVGFEREMGPVTLRADLREIWTPMPSNTLLKTSVGLPFPVSNLADKGLGLSFGYRLDWTHTGVEVQNVQTRISEFRHGVVVGMQWAGGFGG